MSTALQTSVIGRISSLIEEINGVKTAADKSAKPNGKPTTKQATELGLSGSAKQDPGGYQGGSDHPSARAASNVQKTPLGSRAKENETDVKEDHPGAGVDNTSEGGGGTQDDKQLNIGTNQSSTGEDPSVEDDYKGTKEDKKEGDRGGTSHPANAEDVGEKYSSHSFADLTKVAYTKMNELLADVANGQAPASVSKQAGVQSRPAAGAGQPAISAQEKQAAAQAIIEQTILDARLNADLVGEFLTKYSEKYAGLLKGGATDGPLGGAMEGEGGGGPPMDPAATAGGPPPDAGGPPPGGEGGGGGGLDEMINALLQMGMTPEDIEAALQAHMGGGGEGGMPAGGAPPGAEMAGAGGGPPMGGDMGKMGRARGLNDDQLVMLKAAHMASYRFRSGNWQARPVQPGTKEAHERTELQRYILEVCGFGR